jgi:hypothetical protein
MTTTNNPQKQILIPYIDNMESKSSGIGLFSLIGMVWAGIVTWDITHDIGWTALHTLFGWLYVVCHYLGFHF